MAYYWLFITLSWLGGVSLQYINTDTNDAMSNQLTNLQYPMPYTSYFNLPERNDFDYANDAPMPGLDQYENEGQTVELKRNRRTIDDEKSIDVGGGWQTNMLDIEKTGYQHNDGDGTPVIIQNRPSVEENSTEVNFEKALEKRNFSPWGGKRDNAHLEHMWTWKRATNVREPSMPKRVRFSPWGGKRSGQIIYKTSNKGSKIIFSTTIPELTRIVTNYAPNGERLALRGFKIGPSRDKRHKILALSTKMDEGALREALPYKTFIDTFPRFFKPGHTYTNVALKTDGKRKVKFSAWGGKRSPPIVGPIWTPGPKNLKESTLDAILVIRNNPEIAHDINKQF